MKPELFALHAYASGRRWKQGRTNSVAENCRRVVIDVDWRGKVRLKNAYRQDDWIIKGLTVEQASAFLALHTEEIE